MRWVALALLLALPSLSAAGGPPLEAPTAQVVEQGGVREVHVRTKLADYLFSAEGGVLRSAYLHFTPIGMGPVELVPDTETERGSGPGKLARSFQEDGLFPFQLEVDGEPTDKLRYDLSQERTDGRLVLTFTAQAGGLQVGKRFVVTENPYYALRFTLTLANASGAPLELSRGVRLSLGRGVGPSPDFGEQKSQGFEGIGFTGGGLVLFLRRLSSEPPLAPFEAAVAGGRVLGVEVAPLSLAPGESRTYPFELYAGRAKYTLLEHEGLGQLAPPGLFDRFIIPVVKLLDWIYGITSNYGWAIILFTLITRVVLFPLTRKQFHSMAQMAELRPKMEQLQQRYPTLKRLKELHPNLSQEELIRRDRENRRALQRKMMELYREEGVNPLGGCLPMLIQLPILIILWRAIIYSAETIHLSPGFLWMPDLSLHDPTYLIVGLTAVMMLLQTKTTPTMTTSGQGPNQLVFMLFSVGIMVLFLKDFPAGLWLYYFLTTVIQVGQQVFIQWEMDRLKRAKEAAKLAGSGASSPDAEGAADSGGEDQEKGKKGQERKRRQET